MKKRVKTENLIERKKAFAATLKRAAIFSLSWIFLAVFAFFSDFKPVRAEELSWRKIACFSTWYNPNEGGRCENIALAASFIDGVTIQPYGELSFNQTVGARTARAGFKNAKIISNGEYTLGLGGGVCQVSTTLYNLALLAGLMVTEFHPHSLSVGYAPPSRDAMVSSESDLRLYNPYEFPVRLRASAKNGDLRTSCYGLNAPLPRFTRKIVSRIVEEIPPQESEVRTGDEDKILREPRNGIKSEAYLETYEKGALVGRKRLRKDFYAPIKGIIVEKTS